MTGPSTPSAIPEQCSPMTVIVRRAGMEDLAAVWDQVPGLASASVMAADWSDASYRAYLALETANTAIQAKALFIACLRAEKASLAASPENADAARERIIGFAAFSAIPGVGECALDNMVVAESSRRQGIGARLLAAGLLWCRAHSGSSVWLEVRASNQGAIALYERAGFSIVGRRPDYYSKPVEGALQMQKILGPVA